jgi:hypothetical protein
MHGIFKRAKKLYRLPTNPTGLPKRTSVNLPPGDRSEEDADSETGAACRPRVG